MVFNQALFALRRRMFYTGFRLALTMGSKTMDRAQFRDWVSSIDELTATQRREVAAVRPSPDRLAGIVEADETFALESRKGERNLNRRPRRRGARHSSRERQSLRRRAGAGGGGGPCTSRRSTAATARSRASCGVPAASPPSVSTAI